MGTVNSYEGGSYTVPDIGEENWGGSSGVDGLLNALASNVLQKTGGAWTLSADVDFGGSAGLKSLHFKSRSSSIAATGIVRLANAESVVWRNAADDGDIALTVNSSGAMVFAGVTLFNSSGVLQVPAGGTGLASYTAGDLVYASAGTTIAKLAIGGANTVLATDGSTPSWRTIVNADVNAAAAIARTKVANGTADYVVINDGSGTFSEEAALAISRGGTGQATATAGFDALSPTTTKGDMVVSDGSNNVRLAVGTDTHVLTLDSAQSEGVKWAAQATAPDHVYQLSNVGISATAGSGALTVALEQSDGSTDPTGGSEAKVGFRSTTITTGGFTVQEYSTGTTVVIPSGATLGYASGEDNQVFVYAVYDGSNKDVAVSGFRVNEEELHATTTISTGADDKNTLYTTTGRTGAAIRLIGVIFIQDMTTAGTWTAPDRLYAAAGPSQLTGNESVYARYSTATADSLTNAVAEIMYYATKSVDSHGSVTGTSFAAQDWKFTANYAGYYLVNARIAMNGTTAWGIGETIIINILKNGAVVSREILEMFDNPTNTLSVGMSVSDGVELLAGDYIQISVVQSSGSDLALSGSALDNRISIVKQ